MQSEHNQNTEHKSDRNSHSSSQRTPLFPWCSQREKRTRQWKQRMRKWKQRMRQTHLLHSACYSGVGSPVPKVSPRRKILNHDFLTNFSSTASVDPGKMWSIFAEEIKEYDENVTNAQNDNIDGVLVFVSHDFADCGTPRNDRLERLASSLQSSPFLLLRAIRSCHPTLAIGPRFFSSKYHSSLLVLRMGRTRHSGTLRGFPLAVPYSGSTYCGS